MALIGAATPATSMTPVTGTAAPVGSPVPESGRTDPDLTALRHIWERQAEAWARGDGNAYAMNYTPDADLVNIKGEHLHSRPVIATQIQRYFNNQLKNTHLLRLEEKVRLISPTMAIIVRKDCVLYGAEKSCRPDTLSLNTSVAVKHLGKWMITSFHNTLVMPQDDQRPPFRISSTS
ncbi:hypothetical protein GCM10022226_51540 [Sphaerisporangium flaviroseum]|uniref:Calcium/calmodulin-dependent protein kinase II association-domain domain-containing protein n=1 Tax=Sphaerisporangium flaviroseum TaxID=509199 RepID=A0ABP7IQN8_9ACTN